MKKLLSGVVLSALAVCVFSGCSPDQCTLKIPTSAIEKASAGSFEYVTATCVFSDADSIKENFPKIRSIALRYLGEGATMTTRNDEVRAVFKIPVVSETGMPNLPGASVARLKYDDGKLTLVGTSRLDALNKEFSEIDCTLEVDLNASKLLFRLVGNSSPVKVRATAVFVDEEPKLHYSDSVEIGDVVDIEFRCGSDSVYSVIRPFIEVAR